MRVLLFITRVSVLFLLILSAQHCMSYEQPCLDESLEYFCLNQALVCDGLAHCYDNSDEADCGEDYHSSRVVDGCQNT